MSKVKGRKHIFRQIKSNTLSLFKIVEVLDIPRCKIVHQSLTYINFTIYSSLISFKTVKCILVRLEIIITLE